MLLVTSEDAILEQKERAYEYYKKSPLVEKWDILAGALLVVLLVVMLLVIFLPPAGSEVEIYRDGQLIATYPLDQNRAFEVGGVRINIFNGHVDVVEADCPDQLCVHARSISTSGSSIICVPNRLVVKITGKADVEGITQ